MGWKILELKSRKEQKTSTIIWQIIFTLGIDFWDSLVLIEFIPRVSFTWDFSKSQISLCHHRVDSCKKLRPCKLYRLDFGMLRNRTWVYMGFPRCSHDFPASEISPGCTAHQATAFIGQSFPRVQGQGWCVLWKYPTRREKNHGTWCRYWKFTIETW